MQLSSTVLMLRLEVRQRNRASCVFLHKLSTTSESTTARYVNPLCRWEQELCQVLDLTGTLFESCATTAISILEFLAVAWYSIRKAN